MLRADVDECSLNTAICGAGTCMNLEGNYTCLCPDGHMLMPDRNCMGKRMTSILCSHKLIYSVTQGIDTLINNINRLHSYKCTHVSRYTHWILGCKINTMWLLIDHVLFVITQMHVS